MTPSPLPRPDGRAADQLREVTLDLGAVPYAEGSCLVAFGDTRVLCAASVAEGAPGWKRDGGGWVTAEYAMLPRATHQRSRRERRETGGRTQEIQRLIGRSLRATVDLAVLSGWTIQIDCDVLQADGGTRTASITGGAVALAEACRWLVRTGRIAENPFRRLVAAVSIGIVDGEPRLDLNYAEDSVAEVDLNLVAHSREEIIEVQGTAEQGAFSRSELGAMLDLGTRGIEILTAAQTAATG